MLDAYEIMSPSDDPIFMSLTQNFLRDAGWDQTRAGDENLEVLWQRAKTSPSWLTKGPNISRVRRFAYLYRAESDDERWHARTYSLLMTCQVLGLMQKDSLSAFKSSGTTTSTACAAASSPSTAPPSMQQDTVQAERLRAAAANQLELTAMLHADSANQDR